MANFRQEIAEQVENRLGSSKNHQPGRNFLSWTRAVPGSLSQLNTIIENFLLYHNCPFYMMRYFPILLFLFIYAYYLNA